jgi:hypothetical protein
LVAYLHFARPHLFLICRAAERFSKDDVARGLLFRPFPISYLGIQLTFETKESENMDKRPETCL